MSDLEVVDSNHGKHTWISSASTSDDFSFVLLNFDHNLVDASDFIFT